jgi:hypothetical protein
LSPLLAYSWTPILTQFFFLIWKRWLISPTLHQRCLFKFYLTKIFQENTSKNSKLLPPTTANYRGITNTTRTLVYKLTNWLTKWSWMKASDTFGVHDNSEKICYILWITWINQLEQVKSNYDHQKSIRRKS